MTLTKRQTIEVEIAQLLHSVDEICHLMKGPLPNGERAMYHADRQDLRARIAELQAQLEVTDAER